MESVEIGSVPERVVLSGDQTGLLISWPGGPVTHLNAAALRAACRCAGCSARPPHETGMLSPAPVTVDGVQPVGTYGINIAFSDGHARGIYPWALLRDLAA